MGACKTSETEKAKLHRKESEEAELEEDRRTRKDIEKKRAWH